MIEVLNWRPGTSSINHIYGKLTGARGNRDLFRAMFLRCTSATATEILVVHCTTILSLTLVCEFRTHLCLSFWCLPVLGFVEKESGNAGLGWIATQNSSVPIPARCLLAGHLLVTESAKISRALVQAFLLTVP